MKNDRSEKANEALVRASAPRKLHKPHRPMGDMAIEQVVTYTCEDGSASGLDTSQVG